jgi:hypothetical protein
MQEIDWNEYDNCAEWCAKRGFAGKIGDPLPTGLSVACFDEIAEHPEEFMERVRDTAYALAMQEAP